MSAGIYRIVVRRQTGSELYYIGQSIDLERRQVDHLRHLRGGRHDNPRLQALFRKYGESSFLFEVLLICESSNLLIYEQSILDLYITYFCGAVVNILRECVASPKGMKRSDEARARMSAAKKGKPGRSWTPESRSKVSATKKGHAPARSAVEAAIVARSAKSVSAATREKMSAAQKGRRHSLESRAKMSAVRKVIYESPDARARLSLSLLGNRNGAGHKVSAAARQKMSVAAIRREARKRANVGALHEVVE